MGEGEGQRGSAHTSERERDTLRERKMKTKPKRAKEREYLRERKGGKEIGGTLQWTIE